MPTQVPVGKRWIGREHPVCVVAEIGINHNGDLETAKKLIDAAVVAGCDAVKFQKRTPELCVPPEQRDLRRDTPWGIMTYMEYRERVEFGREEYAEIDEYCRSKRILWFASCWDEPSVDFIEEFDPVCHKVPSACLTDSALLARLAQTIRPIMLSTGMSSLDEMDNAVRSLPQDLLMVAHTTSAYPCPPAELNLKMIPALWRRYDCPVGYSGHEVGLQTTCAAVALGACFIERHITLDRAMWGSDQAASIEPHGLIRLVRDIRVIEAALGDAIKRVYPSEIAAMKRLRRVQHAGATA